MSSSATNSDFQPIATETHSFIGPIAAITAASTSAEWDAGPSVSTAVSAGLDRDSYLITTDEIDRLYVEFTPLVRRLMRQYAGEDFELRQDLAGEIYWRFSVYYREFDPSLGVPLRPYLVRRLTASVYTYVRQRWRLRPREVSLDSVLSENLQSRGEANRRGPGAFSRAGGSGTLSSSLISDWTNDPTPDWDDAIVAKHVRLSLPALIAGLPNRQRQVLLMHYYDHRSFDEIATDMSIRPATARSLLRHAIAKLRVALAPEACAHAGRD